jgi:hypothetical protein
MRCQHRPRELVPLLVRQLEVFPIAVFVEPLDYTDEA